jgi:hypothetical protein
MPACRGEACLAPTGHAILRPNRIHPSGFLRLSFQWQDGLRRTLTLELRFLESNTSMDDGGHVHGGRFARKKRPQSGHAPRFSSSPIRGGLRGAVRSHPAWFPHHCRKPFPWTSQAAWQVFHQCMGRKVTDAWMDARKKRSRPLRRDRPAVNRRKPGWECTGRSAGTPSGSGP